MVAVPISEEAGVGDAQEQSYVVEARGLAKSYGPTVAVANVDVLVAQGSGFGVLGPNGSGKSTTVRMLLGLAKPDRGTVRLFGQALKDHGPDVLARVGSVVETPAFIPYVSGRDNLRLIDRYRPGAGSAAIERTLERVHLEAAAHHRFKNYSLGMKQRLGIAFLSASGVNVPTCPFLKSPTNRS